jgi:hypothetical protein
MNPNEYRGRLISTFSVLEKAIEYFIAKHFVASEETALEMMQVILDRMTFEAKRTSLKYILDKRSDRSGFKKTKNNSYPSSKFLEEIRLLNDERNIFAHYVLGTENYKKDSVIELIKFRDNSTLLTYNSKEFAKIIVRIESAISNVLRDTMIPN